MVHLLLFYRIFLYSIGFSYLVIAILKYLATGKPVVKAFLLFWSSMTITAAGYAIDFYVIKNTATGMYSLSYIIMQLGALFISVALPNFIHILFNIQKQRIIYLFILICLPLMVCILLPISAEWTQGIVNFIMITIVVSILYSLIISIIEVVRLADGKDRITGYLFLFTILILFILLLVIDIFPINNNGDFLIFPVFYIWVGSFFIISGYGRFRYSDNPIISIPDNFIKKFKLTNREAEVILLLIEGARYKSIADKLFISLNTVSTHIRHIYDKTNTNSKVQLRKVISDFR